MELICINCDKNIRGNDQHYFCRWCKKFSVLINKQEVDYYDIEYCGYRFFSSISYDCLIISKADVLKKVLELEYFVPLLPEHFTPEYFDKHMMKYIKLLAFK